MVKVNVTNTFFWKSFENNYLYELERALFIECHIRVFHKKNNIQLGCVSKAYIKDLMYLKRNTKFLPDR
jgi:hypothetical protein